MRLALSLTLPRDAVSVPLTRRVLSVALETAGVTPDCVHDIELAVTEACANVINHAGQGHDYEVGIDIADGELSLQIVDTGHGFGQSAAQHDQDELAESGHGLTLMRALTDTAVFDNASGGGGSVRLTKRLSWVAGQPLLSDTVSYPTITIPENGVGGQTNGEPAL